MDEMRPRGQETGAAGWDGTERRRAIQDRRAEVPGTAVVPVASGRRSAWRSPQRSVGRLLARFCDVLVGAALRWVLELLAELTLALLR
ncbi:hypothetical protein ACWCYY_38640 [Kitasatospora sp. NPDC001664]